MREFRTSGSVGAPGGQPPGATQWAEADTSTGGSAWVRAVADGRRSRNVGRPGAKVARLEERAGTSTWNGQRRRTASGVQALGSRVTCGESPLESRLRSWAVRFCPVGPSTANSG